MGVPYLVKNVISYGVADMPCGFKRDSSRGSGVCLWLKTVGFDSSYVVQASRFSIVEVPGGEPVGVISSVKVSLYG